MRLYGKTSIFAKQRNLGIKPSNNPGNSSVISEIVERKYDENSLVSSLTSSSRFPEVISIDCHEGNRELSNESLFANLMRQSKVKEKEATIFENLEDIKNEVSSDNLELLNTMTPEDIIRERNELLKTINPELVKFLKSKKKPAQVSNMEPEETDHAMKDIENLPVNNIIDEVNIHHYVNMNVLEPEKLEWLKNIDKIFDVPKDRNYEARFDFKGFLLPYIFDDESTQIDNRELYCHEDECHRPGYTLQELFRLARADVLQQRVSAFNAIAGILGMYMQGFYDGIIELPLSKIFFFLRFGLDENILAVSEACIRSLSHIFYNEVDEALLDIVYETNAGYIQPLMSNQTSTCNVSDVQDSMEKLQLFETTLETDVLVDDINKESMTDFHLAEVNLVECLQRTNIIERISYIILVMRADQSTTVSCLKVLIRLARYSQEFVEKIFAKRPLLCYMLSGENLKMEKPKEAVNTIKLIRIMASYSQTMMYKLLDESLLEKLRMFVSSQNDMSVEEIKLQVECFRLLRLYFTTNSNKDSFSSIILPLRYLLEWHLHNLDFHLGNHFLCRIHVSALLYLIQQSEIKVSYSIFGETLKMCCKKWFLRATSESIVDMSQKVLLGCLLDVVGTFSKHIPEFFYDFINDYLMNFLASKNFKVMTRSLIDSSLLLNDFIDRRLIHSQLPNLGSILRKKQNRRDAPKTVYSQDYAIHFLHSVLIFSSTFDSSEDETKNKMCQNIKRTLFASDLEEYLKRFGKLDKSPVYSTNWFAQIEIKLIFNILKIKEYQEETWIYNVAYNLLKCLTTDKFLLVIDLFDNIIFNQDFCGKILNKSDLQRMKYVYNGLVLSKVKEKKPYAAVVEGWSANLLKDIWIYELLLIFLHNIGIKNGDSIELIETDLSEEEIIVTTLKFKKFLNSQQVNILSHDEQLMFLMLIYLGKELNFLNSDIKEMIKGEFELLKGKIFKFNVKLNNEKDFESLYKMFLETFQAQSYADVLFSSFVMIPLMQSYDDKWRKIVWSEYAMILKFITCQENDLLYPVKKYLEPPETDDSLLNTYRQSLKYLRKESLPYKIAVHHLCRSRSK